MEKIKFYRERFYLEKIAYNNGCTRVKIDKEMKKSLRYQVLILVNPEIGFQAVDLYDRNEATVSPAFKSAWVMVRTKEVEDEVQKYDEEEVWVIKSFIHHFSDTRPEITEKLCSALGDDIVSKYHHCYGKLGIEKFRSGLFKMDTGKRTDEQDARNYGRPRYSVMNLIKDLNNTPDLQIYTDPELIGKYKRISRRTWDGSSLLMDRWAKLVGITGNRVRANVSVTTISKVKVTIPENEVGVEPGEKELKSLRSFSLIVDGTLNMDEIGIKTSNNKLIGKLKRLGVVEPMLMMDEYVVNLKKLPIFKKTAPLYGSQLGYAEYSVKESEIKTKYLELLKYKLEKSLPELPKKMTEEEKDEKTKFLESLGIFGDTYYPGKTKVMDIEKSYETIEVIGKVDGIPGNLYPNIRNFINTGTCKNTAIQKILSVFKGLKKDDLKEIEKELNYQTLEKKVRVEHLKLLKFRLIAGKTFKLAGKGFPTLERINVAINDDTKVSWVVKDTIVNI